MGEETVDSLLNVLHLLGFSEVEAIADNLREACQVCMTIRSPALSRTYKSDCRRREVSVLNSGDFYRIIRAGRYYSCWLTT